MTSRWMIPSGCPCGVARGVHALEGAQHLAGDVTGHAGVSLRESPRQPPQEAIEVAAVDELHREPRLVAVHPRAEDLDDVRVAHGGVERRLALEHRPSLGVGGEVGQEALDDELARLAVASMGRAT